MSKLISWKMKETYGMSIVNPRPVYNVDLTCMTLHARQILKDIIEKNPDKEDIWLELFDHCDKHHIKIFNEEKNG